MFTNPIGRCAFIFVGSTGAVLATRSAIRSLANACASAAVDACCCAMVRSISLPAMYLLAN